MNTLAETLGNLAVELDATRLSILFIGLICLAVIGLAALIVKQFGKRK